MTACELLTELVRCPSVNPGDLKTFEYPYGEGKLVDFLARYLKKMGGEVFIEEVLLGRPNMWAHFKGRDSNHTILLDGHTDTVSHLNMIVKPFGAEVRGGRLYGRGACDTKGPMAAMLLALESALSNEGLACDVIFSATCNEENGGTGANKLVESVKADFAVIGEPTELKLVTRHKGVMRADITVHGKASHSSTPELGCNAIYNANRIVSALEVLGNNLNSKIPDPVLGNATLAVVQIKGGTASNIIPDCCTIQIDRRIMPGEDAETIKALIKSVVCDAVADTIKSPLEITWTQFYPPMETHDNLPDLIALDVALKSVTGSATYDAVAYGTNGGFYAQAGISCVVFGPGSIADAHTNNESIDLQEIETAAKVLHNFLITG
jgi:acetylornithine deacetylase